MNGRFLAVIGLGVALGVAASSSGWNPQARGQASEAKPSAQARELKLLETQFTAAAKELEAVDNQLSRLHEQRNALRASIQVLQAQYESARALHRPTTPVLNLPAVHDKLDQILNHLDKIEHRLDRLEKGKGK